MFSQSPVSVWFRLRLEWDVAGKAPSLSWPWRLSRWLNFGVRGSTRRCATIETVSEQNFLWSYICHFFHPKRNNTDKRGHRRHVRSQSVQGLGVEDGNPTYELVPAFSKRDIFGFRGTTRRVCRVIWH